jgi:ribose transport system ATP-binding protein
MARDVLLGLEGISKTYPGVKANDDVSFAIGAGEVHALLGENGAGKSTFVKIITGAYARDAGEVRVSGKQAELNSTAQAHEAGISVVFQELSLVPHLTVAENIYLGEWPTRHGIVSWSRMAQEAQALLRQFGVKAHPHDITGSLGIGTQQMIEIVKACRRKDFKILILDEPTSALSDVETDTLFNFLRGLREQGVSVIYISHRLAEIQRICDRVTVFRNGKNIETCSTQDVSIEYIVSLMVGRNLSDRFPPKPASAQPHGLRVTGLKNPKLDNISFEAHRGQIVGVSGLIGSGKTELLRAIFGADPLEAGTVSLDEQVLNIRSPRDAIRAGMGLLPESRKEQALVLTANNIVNISLSSLQQFAQPVLSLKKECDGAADFMQQVDVRPTDPYNMVVNLSGGNQQKVVLARWLLARSSVLLFDEPTRGIDVGAKYQIYSLMSTLANNGGCVLVASSDVEELVGICNRVIVLARGKIVADLPDHELDEETLLHAAVSA